MKKCIALFVVILFFLVVKIAGANLVVNGGFETGDFTGWNLIPASEYSLCFVEGVNGAHHTGNCSVYFGAWGLYDDTITQTIATDPGKTYTFDFWLTHNIHYDVPNDFHASWNGTDLLDISNIAFDWTHYSYTVTANSPYSTIAFSGKEDLAYYILDDVSVSPSSDVPIPGAIWLLGSGLIGMTCLRLFRMC